MLTSHHGQRTSNATVLRELLQIGDALHWRSWSAALAEAERRSVPILALAEHSWSNSAHQLVGSLGENEPLRTLIEERLVPTLVDPFGHPDLVASWQWASIALTGTWGPPLLVFLTHEGIPFLSYPTMKLEGLPPYPSLHSLVQTIGEAYAVDPASFHEEALALASRAVGELTDPDPSMDGLWQSIAESIDPEYGGLREEPKHLHPQLLWSLLEGLTEDKHSGAAAEFVRQTLSQAWRGGIYDQLDTGFHHCSRDDRWVVPHFEKLIPLNAQMAALYARAGQALEEETFRETSSSLASFALQALQDDVVAIGSDSFYYTWTPQEVTDQIPPRYVQVIGFHFGLTRHQSRHVLHRVLESTQMGRYVYEAPEILQQRIVEGRREMLNVRNQRPAPEMVRSPNASWIFETARWLLVAAEHGCPVPADDVRTWLQRYLDAHPPATSPIAQGNNGDPNRQIWLEELTSRMAALLAAYRLEKDPDLLARAREEADTIIANHRHQTGGWSDRPVSATKPSRSLAVIDTTIPSSVATLTKSLDELGRHTGEERYRSIAREQLLPHLSAATECEYWAASIWSASTLLTH
jgi:uncharacterized protein